MSASPSPWSADVLTLPVVGFTHTHAVTLIVDGDTDNPHQLTPTKSEVSYQSSRTPRVVATLEVAWPSASVLALLNPREHELRVWVDAGYKIGTSTRYDTHQLADLTVTTVARDYIAQTVTITATSDEVVPINYAAEAAYAYSAGDNVVTAIKALVADAFPGDALTWDTTDADLTSTFQRAQRVEIGEDRWDAVVDWAESIGMRVWHDGAGTWVIGTQPASPGAKAAVNLRVGAGGQTSALQVVDTLDGYANRVAVVYEYKSGTSAATVTTEGAVATTGANPPRMLVVPRKRKPDRPQRAARTALRRALRRGHRTELTATAYYWVRPGDTVTQQVPGAPTERLLVETVAFQLDAGQMSLTSQTTPTAPLDAITTSAFT